MHICSGWADTGYGFGLSSIHFFFGTDIIRVIYFNKNQK